MGFNGHESEMNLSELSQGATAKVVAFDSSGPEAHRLQELGLTPGTVFTVVKVAPFGDPIELEFRGTRLCLRRQEVGGLRVEIIPDKK